MKSIVTPVTPKPKTLIELPALVTGTELNSVYFVVNRYNGYLYGVNVSHPMEPNHPGGMPKLTNCIAEDQAKLFEGTVLLSNEVRD
jgi:hypothetical protein